jgi:ActR/RegA family two-component response regulator
MQTILELNNFEVISASSVNEALSHIAAEKFGVLLCDLHMPGRGDGLTVVSAMRHANAEALTIVFSGYPEMKEALSAILVQADEILVKPVGIPALIELITKRLATGNRSETKVLESVATILERECGATIQDWLLRVQHDEDLTRISLNCCAIWFRVCAKGKISAQATKNPILHGSTENCGTRRATQQPCSSRNRGCFR